MDPIFWRRCFAVIFHLFIDGYCMVSTPYQNYLYHLTFHIQGILNFGNVNDTLFEYGDVYWLLGGEVIGPLINKGDSNCILMIMSSSPIVPHPASNGLPSNDNPSVNPSLIRSRTYRQNGDGGQWRNNPSPHSQVKYFFFRCKIYIFGQGKYFGLVQIILNKKKNNFSLLKLLFDLYVQ